jgi:hypothetical protein
MRRTSGASGRLGWAVAVVIVVLVAVNVIDVRVTHASLVLGRLAPRGSWRDRLGGLGSAGRSSAWAGEPGAG